VKITHITGETLDTDALPDTEAMVLEKVEEFRLFCLKNKVPFLMFIDSKGVNDSDYIAFWSFANRVNNYEGDGKEQKPVSLVPVLKTINSFVYSLSQGELYLAQTPKKPLDDL